MPLFQGALPEQQVRAYLDELLRVAEANGVTGRLEGGGAPAEEASEAPEPGAAAAAAAPEGVRRHRGG